MGFIRTDTCLSLLQHLNRSDIDDRALSRNTTLNHGMGTYIKQRELLLLQPVQNETAIMLPKIDQVQSMPMSTTDCTLWLYTLRSLHVLHPHINTSNEALPVDRLLVVHHASCNSIF